MKNNDISLLIDYNLKNLILNFGICKLCEGFLVNPVDCIDCGYSYCEKCAETIQSKKKDVYLVVID